MKWNDVSKKPKNGEEVLGFRTSSDWGDEYLLCMFFKKALLSKTIIQLREILPETDFWMQYSIQKTKAKKLFKKIVFVSKK